MPGCGLGCCRAEAERPTPILPVNASMPLLSIVVPTLDRPDTLRHALATLAVQTGGNCEFVVQNNGGNPAIAALVESFGDARFKHFITPDVVTMTENWELALGHTTGDYVTFIGDDDGLMPDACAIASTLLEQGAFPLLSWAPYAYYWPGYHHPGYRNRLLAAIDFRFTGERVASRAELARFYGFQTHYARLPMIYNSFVRRDVIETMRASVGRYFLGLSPDVTSGIVNAALTPDFVRLSRPLSISGLSQHSTGHRLFFRDGDALETAAGRRDFGVLAKDARLPDLNALPLFLANDMLLVKQHLFPADAFVAVDFKGLAQALATGINDRPELYDRTLHSIRELVTLHGLDAAEIIVPARASTRPPLGTGVTRQGARRVLFRLDGDALGLRSIADAARVIAQFVPGAEALDLANFPLVPPMPMLDRDGVEFGCDGAGAAALLDGWSEPEDWGTWSVAKSCSLRLHLAQRPLEPVRVELVCRAFLAGRHEQLRVLCRIGNMPPQETAFPAVAPGGRRFFQIDPAAIAFDGSVTIAFQLFDPRSPADLGINDDVRPLGIGIEKLRLIG
jgi:glycosyltransferase involved in cell wall biosynthesis